MKDCSFCGKSFIPSSATRLYCGGKCKRAAEFEIRRVNARMEVLESERMRHEMAMEAEHQLNDWLGRSPAQQLEAVNQQIDRERIRLLAIIND